MSTWLPPEAPGQPVRPAYEPPVLGPPQQGEPPLVPADPPAWKRFIGPLLVVGAFLLKFGKVAVLFIGKAKFLTTSLSMLVSIGAYSLLFGWKFAVGFVVLLLIHEMGHVWQLRREGIEASAPMFIPFLGAAIMAKSMGDDAAAEARVGLAGPIVGSVAAAACIPIWLATGSEFWQALAFTGLFLNLFNLLPVVPLDGGRAMAALSPWMWFVGLFGVFALLFTFPNPILILIAIFGVIEVARRWKSRGDAYYKIRGRQRAIIAVTYLALIVALALGMDATYLERDFDDV